MDFEIVMSHQKKKLCFFVFLCYFNLHHLIININFKLYKNNVKENSLSLFYEHLYTFKIIKVFFLCGKLKSANTHNIEILKFF
jgi:hypothetical protein